MFFLTYILSLSKMKLMSTSQDKETENSLKSPNLYKLNDPPLVSFKVTNPVTYLKLWFKKVWANEGVVLHLRIKPLTIIIIAMLFTGTGLGIGKLALPFWPFNSEILQINPTPTPGISQPTPTSNPWVEAAYAGSLHKSENNKFYLVISSGEAITLEIPPNINLSGLVGKRILASGLYDQLIRVLKVTDASDMEILPTKTVPVPTSVPSPMTSIVPTISL